MPLYEYRCHECGEIFEILQRMGEGADGLACPRCGSENPRRQLSRFAGATTGSTKGAACGPGGFT